MSKRRLSLFFRQSRWADTDEVGIYAAVDLEKHGTLDIIVEKDYSVSRLIPNSRASAAFELPRATRRRNSAARVGDNDGFLPVYFPSLFAIAIVVFN
jgi:hypothetical protein